MDELSGDAAAAAAASALQMSKGRSFLGNPDLKLENTNWGLFKLKDEVEKSPDGVLGFTMWIRFLRVWDWIEVGLGLVGKESRYLVWRAEAISLLPTSSISGDAPQPMKKIDE